MFDEKITKQEFDVTIAHFSERSMEHTHEIFELKRRISKLERQINAIPCTERVGKTDERTYVFLGPVVIHSTSNGKTYVILEPQEEEKGE